MEQKEPEKASLTGLVRFMIGFYRLVIGFLFVLLGIGMLV
jgi:hypothetical protein